LFAFYRHPQKHFLERQLGLRFTGIEVWAEEREPFAIGRLDKYQIQQEWIAAILANSTLSVAKLQALGLWLHGSPGELELVKLEPEIKAFAEKSGQK